MPSHTEEKISRMPSQAWCQSPVIRPVTVVITPWITPRIVEATE